MPEQPPYTGETELAIRSRMLGSVDSRWDKSERGYLFDAINPAAIEFSMLYSRLNHIYDRIFQPYGIYLDRRASEVGILRLGATPSKGVVRIVTASGKVIPLGSVVSTEVPPNSDAKPVLFSTDVEVTVGAAGYADIAVTCTTAGVLGNVVAGSVKVLVSRVTGITSVTNAAAFTGGNDIESDDALTARIKQKVRKQVASGNAYHYEQWVYEVNPAFLAYVQPLWAGNGTVKVWLANVDKLPAVQAEVDSVQAYISPIVTTPTVEAETLLLGGYGYSTDATQSDDSGSSVKLVYNATGAGWVKDELLETTRLLDADGVKMSGIWRARVLAKASSIAGATNLFQVYVWNTTLGVLAKVDKAGTADATVSFRGNQMTANFAWYEVQFYWNGKDDLYLAAQRLTTDSSATTVWVDQMQYISTFGSPSGKGQSPIGASVTVAAAKQVTINVNATIVYIDPAKKAATDSDILAALTGYVKDLAMQSDNDVRYSRIANTILGVNNVSDYSGLTVNGGTANLAVNPYEIAVIGTVTLT